MVSLMFLGEQLASNFSTCPDLTQLAVSLLFGDNSAAGFKRKENIKISYSRMKCDNVKFVSLWNRHSIRNLQARQQHHRC